MILFFQNMEVPFSRQKWSFFVTEMESYDYGSFTITDVWQKVLVGHLQCTGKNV